MNNTPDYTSRVPHYTFADTLEEQEEQLKTNPLMIRLIESRKGYAGDPHRPIYHYVNPEAMLNDPNGLCFWGGRWHLFYQAYPPGRIPVSTGDTLSAMISSIGETCPMRFTQILKGAVSPGATYVEADRVIAMYHGTEVGNMVAVSSDPLLLNWEKVTGEAVIPMRNPDGSTPPYRVFDPCIWKKDGMYYSLSGGTLPHGPGGKRIRANFLLRSPDLANWEYLHPFLEDDQYTLVGDDGACPYFWPIGDRHILLFFSHMSGGQYLLGDYDTDRDKFVVTAGAKNNFGAASPAGVHAPSATPDGEGGLICIWNMNPAKPTQGWNQIMTLPRRLTLASRDELAIEPAGDIESLRGAYQTVGAMTLTANQEIVPPKYRRECDGNRCGDRSESAPMVEMNVLRSPQKEEYTRIAFFRERGFRDPDLEREGRDSLITIDSSYSSIAPDVLSRAPETAAVFIEPDETLKLRVFIDKSVVEVFVNGKQCVAMRVYPDRKDSVGVSLRSQGQDSELRSLDAWQMETIYAA